MSDSKTHEVEITQDPSRLAQLINEGDVAMLTTKASDGKLNSRPMETIGIESTGELLFFAKIDSTMAEEMTHDNHVNLAYIKDAGENFVSVSGAAQLIRDKNTIEQHWNERYKKWIPEGADDPELTLIKIVAVAAEHWGKRGMIEGIAHLLNYGATGPKRIHETIET